ncbi:hypothetical protein [Blautia massiliensis (ex Liu et al. 2021)]|uniref:hypothetical protein n=1 Tax=Blautia massiliensis (ex Liu et al. 2021) TaxID=3062492 RepID=UPI003F89DDA2
MIVHLFLTLLHRSPRVVRRSINGGNPQGTPADIFHVVPDPCRYKSHITRSEISAKIKTIPTLPHPDNGTAFLNPNYLVCIRMIFQPNLATRRDTHQRHLQMASCPNSHPEILILLRCIFCMKNIRFLPKICVPPMIIIHKKAPLPSSVTSYAQTKKEALINLKYYPQISKWNIAKLSDSSVLEQHSPAFIIKEKHGV